jgi:hypothetical protein
MTTEKILQVCMCCITGKPLTDCKSINFIQLNFRASWEFPVWGNFNTGHKHMAVAYVHDSCLDENGYVTGEVKSAVEFQGDKVIYHPIIKGIRCKVCGCTENDCRQCIEKTGRPCYWVTADLCSACEVMSVYTIYEPNQENSSYPTAYTIAKHDIIKGKVIRDPYYLFIHLDLEICRKELRCKGAANIGREKEDDKSILENWI